MLTGAKLERQPNETRCRCARRFSRPQRHPTDDQRAGDTRYRAGRDPPPAYDNQRIAVPGELRGRRTACAAEHTDVSCEDITASWDRDDESVLARLLAENLSQRRNVLVETVLLDDDAAPDSLHQGVLVQELPRTLHEISKGVEHLRLKREDLSGRRKQQPASGIEAKPRKFVNRRLFCVRHSVTQKNSRRMSHGTQV